MTTTHNVIYVGNFSVPFSTESHLAATLEGLGHGVTRAQENALTAQDVESMLPGHTILLWTKTGDWLRGDAWSMLRTAKKLGIPTVAYHLDLFAPLPRGANISNEPWWSCDYVFTADGGSDDFWKKHGINHIWMPPAVYEAEAYMAEPEDTEYTFTHDTFWHHDVIFTGQRDYHPEWPYRPKLVDWLAETYGDRFRRFPMPGEHAVRGHALNRLYASSKVVVGDSLVLGFNHANYWSDRVPEVMGRGGFLIMPEIKGLSDWFDTGTETPELVTYPFNDFDRLRELIDYYLEHDDEREAIRRRGHEAVRRHSTYRHRMEVMLGIVEDAL